MALHIGCENTCRVAKCDIITNNNNKHVGKISLLVTVFVSHGKRVQCRRINLRIIPIYLLKLCKMCM